MNEQLLKPCPFCGISTAPKLVEYCTKWYVCCDKRVGGCGADFDTFKTRLQAIDAWNKRADQSKDIDARIEQARIAERAAHAAEIERLNAERETIISDFLKRTGQYVTNDASREAAIAAAVAAEREAISEQLRELADELGYGSSWWGPPGGLLLRAADMVSARSAT